MARRAATLTATDGRTLRSARSREAIVRALYDLIGEGVEGPTAQQVADRARVDIRTVFRHFSDMESLYATIDARLQAAVAPVMAEEPPQGGVEVRARALVRKRATAFEQVAPFKRSAERARWRSPFLRSQHEALVGVLRQDLLRSLPELARAPADLVDALDQATSFEAWERLRGDQGLGRARAQAAMEHAAVALVRDLARRGTGR